MSENNFLWWPKIFQQLLLKISSSKSTNSSQQSPFSVNPVEMWRRTKRTVAHRWFWEAITTKASLSPYFRSVPALLVMLEFQGWSRDGSPSPWLATSLWSSLFTLSLLSLSLHWFSSLRRLYVPIRTPMHSCVCCNICFDDIFYYIFGYFHLLDQPEDVCLWITNMLFFHWQTQTCDFFTSVCFLLSVFGNLWSLKLLLAASLCQGLLLLQLGNHFYKFKSLSPSVWPTGSSCCSNCHLTAATALTLQISLPCHGETFQALKVKWWALPNKKFEHIKAS